MCTQQLKLTENVLPETVLYLTVNVIDHFGLHFTFYAVFLLKKLCNSQTQKKY